METALIEWLKNPNWTDMVLPFSLSFMFASIGFSFIMKGIKCILQQTTLN